MLFKVCEVVFPVSIGCNVLDIPSHREPFIIGTNFPLINHRPRGPHGTKLLEYAECNFFELQKLLSWTLLAQLFTFRGVWTICQQAWCGPCYLGVGMSVIPITEPVDNNQNKLPRTDQIELTLAFTKECPSRFCLTY